MRCVWPLRLFSVDKKRDVYYTDHGKLPKAKKGGMCDEVSVLRRREYKGD